MTIPTGKERLPVEAAPGAAKGSVWPIRTRTASARLEEGVRVRREHSPLVFIREARGVRPTEDRGRRRK